MAIYYNQQTNEKVEVKKVEKIRETFTNIDGEVSVTQGNYIVTFEDGHKIGVPVADFNTHYAKEQNPAIANQSEK